MMEKKIVSQGWLDERAAASRPAAVQLLAASGCVSGCAMGHAPSLLALAQKSVSGNCVVPLWAGAEAARRLARDRQHDPRAGTPPSQPPNSLVGTTSLPCAINSGHRVHVGNMCSNTAARALLIEECGQHLLARRVRMVCFLHLPERSELGSEPRRRPFGRRVRPSRGGRVRVSGPPSTCS